MDKNLSTGEKHLYEWNHGMSGGFISSLFELLAKADTANMARLENAFPSEVDVFRRYRNEFDYWEDVQKRYDNFVKTNRHDSETQGGDAMR